MTFLLALLCAAVSTGAALLALVCVSWWATVIVATHTPKPRKRMEQMGPYR